MQNVLKDRVLKETAINLNNFYSCKVLPDWARQSIDELVAKSLFDEINNRFFKNLEFGTGGMRSRTIADFITAAERGISTSRCPEHASVGTAYLNDFNVVGATTALFRYCVKFLRENDGSHELPTVVVSHDTRHFSRKFAELAANIWKILGGHAMIFDSPRSTPQLSFSVRYLHATAGIMITASHNPWHDNGFKAYFGDGAQMVDPHASGVISEFRKVTIDEICDLYSHKTDKLVILGSKVDDDYRKAVADTVLDKNLLCRHSLSVAFSPLHGTGGVATIPLLKEHGINVDVVTAQNDMDPDFSTVKSPNPENPESLSMVVEMAKNKGADLALATDPDGDRLAIVAKNSSGDFEYFSGNVTGALLAEYRINQLKSMGILPTNGTSHAAIIKTFVTTPLIDKIAKFHGLKCINTLTGFKWIGEKMHHYELQMLQNERETNGISIDFDKTSSNARMDLLLKDSTFFIFGCEESYGCLSSPIVRDKDANSACLMVCEMAAYAKSVGKTLCDLRDEMYLKYGYFGETVLNITYEGADGVRKIHNILESYKLLPPKEISGVKVSSIVDFSGGEITDADGKKVPAQDFFICSLENGAKFATRASGTEPKIKFYLFLEKNLRSRSMDELAIVKEQTNAELNDLKRAIQEDVQVRVDFQA